MENFIFCEVIDLTQLFLTWHLVLNISWKVICFFAVPCESVQIKNLFKVNIENTRITSIKFLLSLVNID